MKQVTVVITPRDRYTGVVECIEELYRHTQQQFDLLVPDIGYPRKIVEQINRILEGREGARVVPLGRMIPMEAFQRLQNQIKTPYTVFLDNDSRVTANWLPPLLDCAQATNAALVTPLILEREGLDKGAPLRNHIYT